MFLLWWWYWFLLVAFPKSGVFESVSLGLIMTALLLYSQVYLQQLFMIFLEQNSNFLKQKGSDYFQLILFLFFSFDIQSYILSFILCVIYNVQCKFNMPQTRLAAVWAKLTCINTFINQSINHAGDSLSPEYYNKCICK